MAILLQLQLQLLLLPQLLLIADMATAYDRYHSFCNTTTATDIAATAFDTQNCYHPH
jgi:hypothetical protein